MTEIQNYDDKLKEKDQTIDKLKQTVDINFHIVREIQEMNKMFNNKKKEETKDSMNDCKEESEKERIRHESFDVPNLNESLEPETMPEFIQIQELQTLKENIGTLIGTEKKKNGNKLRDGSQKCIQISNNLGNDVMEKQGEEFNLKSERKNYLQIQEERTKQAFLENEAAEKETEIKLKQAWSRDDETETEYMSESVENLTEKVKRELELSDHLDRTLFSAGDTSSSGIGECASVESGLDDLSQQIVDRLLVKICRDGNQAGSWQGSGGRNSGRVQAYLPTVNLGSKKGSMTETQISDQTKNNELKQLEESMRQKNIEIKQLQDNYKFQLQQEKYHKEELQNSISQERQQSLNLMEKLNTEKKSKSDLQEEIYSLHEEIGDLQTQLLRHRDEIEELSSLYEAEKLQNLVLEEALCAEKDNFNKIGSSLDEERQRCREVSIRDSDTIMDLRTALEVEKENISRLSLDSPFLGKKSHNGSKLSLYGSRQSLPGHKSPALIPEVKIESQDNLIDELLEERNRCDRLKECLEMERDKSAKLAEVTEEEVQELSRQVKQRDDQLVQGSRMLEVAELEKTQLLRELQSNKEKAEKLVMETKAKESEQKRKRTPETENLLYDAFYIEDLESKLEAYRVREEQLQIQIDTLKKSNNSVVTKSIFPLMKSSSFGGSLKNIPLDSQDQAIFFFRKLLRAESYRKALVWQKRYLSLLLSSYQESEILSLGRLARMSGARQMLVADMPRPQGVNIQFRVVVHAIISISRMKFLVKRWKKTKKNAKKAWSQDPGSVSERKDSELSTVEVNRKTTEELEPAVNFARK
eukprot:GFUD01015018.1.p1 GENE.GFUD01015018.1~~GFUD01015018.1.p1  ORF type:complete len:813 (+),score=297.49 GFUD01015018.1:699-3137(+)